MTDPALMDGGTQKWVWVKTSALDKVIVGKTLRKSVRMIPFSSSSLREDSFDEHENGEKGHINWGWTRGTAVGGDDQQPSSDITVVVHDKENRYNGSSVALPPDSFDKGDIVYENDYENDNYPDDLDTLTHLHEPAVLHCLRQRYAADKIYTKTGLIFLAVNPFKDCSSLYSESVKEDYMKRGELGQSLFDKILEEKRRDNGDMEGYLPPHIFGAVDDVYRSMMVMLKNSESSTNCDQSIIVSGESGSGKTYLTGIILQYLTALSRRSVSFGRGRPSLSKRKSSRGVFVNIEQQVLEADPILESFGSASTIRNGNSSRFGKFTQIKFNAKGSITGAVVETYLLEKVRLISQSEGERNYHVFYELLKGKSEEMSEKYFLTDKTAEDFKMTSISGTFDRGDGVDDDFMFQDLLEAMDIMGFPSDEENDIFAVTSAILHASNLTINAIGSEESEVDMTNAHVQPFLSLMGIDADTLNKSMCQFSIKAGKKSHIKPLSKDKSEKGMQAFIKATFGALFTYLVQRINTTTSVEKDLSKSAVEKCPSIGVLDIFGFESCKTNSFEQLCINYCNESLQQQFNTVMLINEQEEYEKEGIVWTPISFADNQDVLDLIDKKGSGIVSILSDQCRSPGASDKRFANVIYRSCSGHSKFQADHRQVASLKFAVHHYAGLVEYDVEGFVDKNRNELPMGATDLLRSSNIKFVNDLADIISPIPQESTKKGSKMRIGRSLNSSIAKPTVVENFGRHLRNLRKKIAHTHPHYVRCLKPNDELVPDKFDPVMVHDQLSNGGVIEAIHASRALYPHKYTHDAFVQRYKSFIDADQPNVSDHQTGVNSADVDVKTVVSAILDGEESSNVDSVYYIDPKDVQIGKTKVFLRQQAFGIMEGLLIRKSAILIQAQTRRYIAQRSFYSTTMSVIILQCLARTRIAVKKSDSIRRQRSAMIAQHTSEESVKDEKDNESKDEQQNGDKLEEGSANITQQTSEEAVKDGKGNECKDEQQNDDKLEEALDQSEKAMLAFGKESDKISDAACTADNGIERSVPNLEGELELEIEPENADEAEQRSSSDVSESKEGSFSRLWKGLLLRCCVSKNVG